jgi:hypothetical protein
MFYIVYLSLVSQFENISFTESVKFSQIERVITNPRYNSYHKIFF